MKDPEQQGGKRPKRDSAHADIAFGRLEASRTGASSEADTTRGTEIGADHNHLDDIAGREHGKDFIFMSRETNGILKQSEPLVLRSLNLKAGVQNGQGVTKDNEKSLRVVVGNENDHGETEINFRGTSRDDKLVDETIGGDRIDFSTTTDDHRKKDNEPKETGNLDQKGAGNPVNSARPKEGFKETTQLSQVHASGDNQDKSSAAKSERRSPQKEKTTPNGDDNGYRTEYQQSTSSELHRLEWTKLEKSIPFRNFVANPQQWDTKAFRKQESPGSQTPSPIEEGLDKDFIDEIWTTQMPIEDGLLPYRSQISRMPGWSSELYEYSPLDFRHEDLRLLRVLPDPSDNKLLQIEMRHGSLTDSYNALSYVWGNPQKHLEVLINNRIFNVQSNLWLFLNVARRKYSSSWFWIDALSIAQHDILERNHQVMQMGNIYESADQVIAWLGYRPDVSTFFDTVHSFLTTGHSSSDLERRREQLQDARPGYDELKSVENWSRAWITQELLLASDLIFLAGETDVSFDELVLFMDMTSLFDFEFLGPLRRLRQRMNGTHHLMTQHRLMTLLHLFQSQRCTVERDRIYSLLSLCIEGPNIEVDYDTSDVLFIKHVLRVCRSTACLCSSQLLSATLSMWTSPLFDMLYLDETPLLQVNLQPREIDKYGREDGTFYGNGTETLGSGSCEFGRCTGCSRRFSLSPTVSNNKVICLADVCSVNKGHLLWSVTESGATEIMLSQQDGQDGICYLAAAFGGIQIEESTVRDIVVLKFSVEALLSRSWCTYRDQLILSNGRLPSGERMLCERTHRANTLFTLSGED